MDFKKIFIFICIIICLFSIASVCASDVNQTVVASEDINQELNLYDGDAVSAPINSDDSSKVSSEENDKLSLNDVGEKLTANKTDSSLELVDPLVLDYGDVATFTVGVKGATGITAKIDSGEVVVNGFDITISKLNVGTHTLSVTTVPDANHNAVTKTSTITVNKIDSVVRVSDVTQGYGATSKLTISSRGANSLIAKIDGKDISVNGNEIIISGLDVGTHTLSITTVPDGNHNAVTNTSTITVRKADSMVALENLTLDYGSTSSMTVNSVGADGLKAYIDGQQVEVVANMVIMIPSNLNVGTHTLTVTTVPDGNHNAVTNTSTITVKKVDFLINVRDVTLEYCESYTMTLNTDGSVKYTASIDGKSVDVVKNKITFPKLNVGTHTLLVSTVKDTNHDSVSKTAKITVTKAKTNMSTSELTALVSQTITLVARLGSVEEINGGVVVFYNGNAKIGQDNVEKGIAKVTYTPSKAGNYSIRVVYDGSSKFESSNSTIKLTVLEKSKINNNSDLIHVEAVDGNISIDVNFPSDATGTVTFTINGEDYEVNLVNGTFNLKLYNLEDGIYTYKLIYPGDEIYDSLSTIGSFSVNNTESVVVHDDSKINITFPALKEISSGVSVQINLPSAATGNMILTINGNTYEFPVEDGKAIVKIPKMDGGEYPYTLTYSGDDTYSSFTRTGTLVEALPNVDPVVLASNVNVVYSAGSQYTIKVKGTDGKPANTTVKIAGKISKTLKSTNGVVKFKVTQAPGTYKITITALGKSITRTITVKHLVTLKSVTVKKSAKKLVLQATLGKISGKYLNKKSVTFKFNGKSYKATTNSKGVAKVTLTSSALKNLKVGKKVTYQATYLKDTVKKTAVIKK